MPDPRYRTVVFDCDSTLTAVEGIDELARGHRAEIERLTTLAMSGSVRLEDVYGRRLELIRPSRAALQDLGRLYIERLVPGARETVERLSRGGVAVQILSGGLAPAVEILAEYLAIPPQRVAAVQLQFATDGRYLGFDSRSPLVKSGGKRMWLEGPGATLPRPLLLVGDGATDLEAKPVVDRFVAFAGVVARPEVMREADVVLRDESLNGVVELVWPDG